MDMGNAVTQARPIMIILVICVVMPIMVVIPIVGDRMRVGVSGLWPEARESNEGRDEEAQEFRES